ncbi:hypothetical protein KJ909_01230 [Patescibacteria group bacterium]|nr:hypothetical protein [Patescibacteria group bacterium]
MADWKTYRDEEYGFEFRYPQTFRVEERKKDSSLETDIIAELVGDEKTETEDVFPYVKVVYFNNPENVSLEKYEEYYYKDKIGGMGLNLYFPSDKLIKIDGINARYQENTTCEPLSCSSVVIPYKEKIFAIYIYGDNRDVIYRQILSSFRFIDETADWKTYKNDKYELEFKYPSNYSFFEYDNDQHNIQKLQIFIKKGEAVFLEIWVNKKYLPGDTQYFLDTQSNGIKNISANAWKTYYLSQGYCDGPGCSPPIFALQTEKNNILYSVSFQNQSEITDLQEKILSTFRFTD